MNPFLVSADMHCTRGDLLRYAGGFRNAVLDASGDLHSAIALLTNDKDKAILTIASAWLTGTPLVPVPDDLRGTPLRNYLNKTGAKLLIADHKTLQYADDGTAPTGRAPAVKILPLSSIVPANKPLDEIPVNENMVFGIFSTSGSSGNRKLVPLKRRQMVSAALAMKLLKPLGKSDYWLHCLPLHHIGGYSIVLRALLNGFGVWSAGAFIADEVTSLLSGNSAIKAVSLVSTQLLRLLEDAHFRPHQDFGFALIGGGPVPENVRKMARGRIPAIFSYGMTETCAQIISTAGHSDVPSGSSGKVIAPNSVSIRDEYGRQPDTRQSGLIWLKGPQVFDGYLDANPGTQSYGSHLAGESASLQSGGPSTARGTPVTADSNQSTSGLEEGWFNTGDYGQMDEHGFVYIEARRDDRIVSGGENVDPDEVEQELVNLPGILDVAVIGLPDDRWGQVVTAVIVPAGGHHIELATIRRFLENRLAAYKIPHRLEVIDLMPKTDLGKIRRSAIRERFTEP